MRRLLAVIFTVSFLIPTGHIESQSDRLNIVATTTILADVVRNVVGDAADVTSLMGVGTDPHSFQPTTHDIITLDEADIVFVNGISLEDSLGEILQETDSAKVIPLSVCVPVLTGFEYEDDHDEDEHEEVEFSGDVGEQCASHYGELNFTPEHTPLYETDCEDCDPHVWMDTQNVMLWTLLARDTLSQLDSDNATIYVANSTTYLDNLIALDEELQTLVNTIPEDKRLLVTNHDVLGYFAQRYGFEIAGSVLPGFSTGAEPGPQEVLAIIEIVEDTDVPAIFVDNSASSETAAQIAEETGAEVIILYTGSLSEADEEAGTYVDYMRFNTSRIVAGLTSD